MTLNKLIKLKEHFDEVIKNRDVHPDVMLSHRWLSSYIKLEEKKLNDNKPVPVEVEKNLKKVAENWHKAFG